MRVRFFLSALAATLTLPVVAEAQTRLDRIEIMSMQLSMLTQGFVIQQAPELMSSLPPIVWSPDTREAYECVIEAYEADVGGDAVDAMLDEMEAAVPTTPLDELVRNSIEIQVGVPEGMTEDRADAIAARCGIDAINEDRMLDEATMEALLESARGE